MLEYSYYFPSNEHFQSKSKPCQSKLLRAYHDKYTIAKQCVEFIFHPRNDYTCVFVLYVCVCVTSFSIIRYARFRFISFYLHYLIFLFRVSRLSSASILLSLVGKIGTHLFFFQSMLVFSILYIFCIV